MSLNPVVSLLGRRLRLAVIGGGPGSFIGAMHRQAAALDNRYELVAAALSSNPEKSLRAGRELGLPAERVYASGLALIEGEKGKDGGADVVAIMTPNDSHYELASAALVAGFDVICDKPMTNTVDEAERLHAAVEASGRVFCLTHNYTGYPMVRQARGMVEAGELGTIRLVQVEYVQGGNAQETDPSPEQSWRHNPAKGGPSLVMGDIGSHAHNLLRFITGLEVAEVAAELGAIVPGRIVHDYAGASASAAPEARSSGSRKCRRSSPSNRRPGRRSCARRTGRARCRWPRVRRASSRGIRRASPRLSPTSTPTPPRRSPHAEPVVSPTRWRLPSRIRTTACSVCALRWPSCSRAPPTAPGSSSMRRFERL